MKFLLDENLSPRLIGRLGRLFPNLTHVRDAGLNRASDATIWEWAKQNGHTIITTDSDFLELSRNLGWPPKVVHLEECDFPLKIVEELLRQNAVRISEFNQDARTGVLALRHGSDTRLR